MKKFTNILFLAFGLALASSLGLGCGQDVSSPEPANEEKEENEENEENLHVVVTLSFFEDMVNQVGGDKVEINALVPVGVEPEEYEPVPLDIRAIEDADLFIYNGLNMERWLPQVISNPEERENFHALAEDDYFDTIALPDGPFKGDPDPHLWTNVNYAKRYVEQIASILSEADPDHREYYKNRMEDYGAELEQLHLWIEEKVEIIPEERRKLITSELCFQYFAEEYGFFHDAIWPINAPEEGTSAQIVRIVEVIDQKDVPVVFVENQIDPRPMEQVSSETGVPVGGVLYSDSLSEPGEGGETYLEMMRSNTTRLVDVLKEKGEY